MPGRVQQAAWLAGFLVLAAGRLPGVAQPLTDGRLLAMLQPLFPGAVFSAKIGEPPHFNAYAAGGVEPHLLGIAFWTTELDPLERGYDGPIKMLVGVDVRGVLTGVVVVEHHEPYGNFSIEPPEFAAQFKGKSVRDPFRVGTDVDAVSRASITVGSATRAIRNSARRAASALLTPPRLVPQ